MPSRPPLACRCGGTVRNGVCSKCGPRKTAPPPYNPTYEAERGNTSERGYDTKWQHARLNYLRGHPLCAECERHGRVTAAVLVDHIVPIADGGARLDESNLQSLCRACHAAKTGRDVAARNKEKRVGVGV